MFEDIERLPRSISESRDWTPDWRNHQAMDYLAAYQDRFELRAGEGAPEGFRRALSSRMIRFPEWEDDQIVMARFWHAAGAALPSSPLIQAFNWCQSCVEMDPSLQHTTALKGWLLAGLTDEEITRRRPMTSCAVSVFHDVWFDVRPYLQAPDALWQVLFGTPLPMGAPEWEIRERAVLHTALAGGVESVDRMLIPNDRLCASEHAWYVAENRRLHREANRGRRAAVRR